MKMIIYQLTYLVACICTVCARIDPEVNMNVPEMLRYWGYPAEEHDVRTSDGYILTVHRIPHGNKNERNGSKPVVLLQHCLLCSSSDWLSNLPNESLGYLLADAGFDVWLGNNRGNTYGLRHVSLKPSQAKFWDFSWDEFALYDLPATLNYILNITGTASLGYVGHSQGTLIGFAAFSVNQQLAKKVNIFIALGPVSTVKTMTSPIKYIAPFTKDVELVCKFIGGRCDFDFLPSNEFMKFLAQFVCGHGVEDIICENVMFLLCGYDFAQMNRTRLSVYVAHTPAGTSMKNIIQYGQMVNSGKCQRFNYYDDKDNFAHYNQTEPPVFNMSDVHVPVVLYSAQNDWLADPQDVQVLIKKLPNVVHATQVPHWEHLDFIWGLDARTIVYQPVIAYLQQYADISKQTGMHH